MTQGIEQGLTGRDDAAYKGTRTFLLVYSAERVGDVTETSQRCCRVLNPTLDDI